MIGLMALCTSLKHTKHIFQTTCDILYDLYDKMFLFYVLFVCFLSSKSKLLLYKVYIMMISLLLECLWWKLRQGREIIARGKNDIFTVSNSVPTVRRDLPHCQHNWHEVTCTQKNKLQALRGLAALFTLVLCILTKYDKLMTMKCP